MSPLVLTLPEPPSANRWWRKWRNRMVLSDEARDYRGTVLQCAVDQHGRAWKRSLVKAPHGVRLHIEWWRQRRSGDLDKRLGVMLDALQGIAYENDAQIIEIHALRFDDPSNPHVYVEIEAA